MASTLFLRRRSPLRCWRKFYASLAGLGKPNCDRLFRIFNTVLPFPDMVDFFSHELPGLGGGRFAFASIVAGTFDSPFFGHVFSFANLP